MYAQVHEWVAKVPFQDMCWGYRKYTANGTRNVAYYMVTGLGPVRATRKREKKGREKKRERKKRI